MSSTTPNGVELCAVDVRALGPLSVVVNGRAVKLGGPRPRTVLAVLLCHVNRTIAQDQLIDLVWQGDPPEAAKATLQSYIYGLRREMGADAIERHGDGYRIEADVHSYDVLRFENMVAGARAQVDADPEAALEVLTTALALWYGSPFGGLDGNTSLAVEIARIEALRLTAVEHRIDARLALGDNADALAELETLVREHPLRERFRAQQMLALYRSGRQAEALRAYQETRRYLGDELGIQPSTELRDLERQILDQSVEPAVHVRDGSERHAERGPQVLRGHELRDVIGTGAFGVVHRAFQPSVGREVAVKVIRPEYVNDAVFVQRFEREARVIAQLEHPHVVPLFDFWRDPAGAYLVMPHLRGGSLASSLNKGGWQTEPAIQLIQQIGSALAYAHRHGVVHRDVKASNVLMDEEGNAYLTDFAISTMGSGASGSESPGGTVAPEVVAGGEHSPASDQFALAMLTYQVLTGLEPDPFRPTTPVSDLRPGLGGDVDAVLRRATSDEPGDRYPSVDAFLRSLRRSVGLDVIDPSEPRGRRIEVGVRNPYKGLRSFQESDSGDFFGRDGVVAELHAALVGHNIVTVVGPSGCGKSSLVRAGLVPSLRAGAIPGSQHWLIAGMYPGADPIEELGLALMAVAVDEPADLMAELYEPQGLVRVVKQIMPDGDHTLVLVVDQFEEVFSLVRSDADRTAFLDAIVDVAGLSTSALKVVLSIRADFFDRPLAHPALREAMAPGVVVVGPPTRDGLTQAIVAPARAVGLDVEPGLVGRILADVDRQPAALPLLQFALTELVEARSGDAITIADYERIGGVVGSLGRTAEELFARLGSAAQDVAEHVFLRLVNVDEVGPDTRRRVRLSELRALDIDQDVIGDVLHRFGALRLLTFDRDPVSRGPTVEIAHEALITEWPRLANWLDARRETLSQARRLRVASIEWEESARDPSFLLRGGRLQQAQALVGGSGGAFTSDEVAFVDASASSERAAAATAGRRRRRAVTLVAVACLAIAGLVIVAFAQRESALRDARAKSVGGIVADARELVDSDPDLALLLGLEAVEEARRTSAGDLEAEALDVLGEATRSQRVMLRTDVGGGGGEIVDVADEVDLVAVADGSSVRLLDLTDGAEVATLAGERDVTDVEFDPGSGRLAVAHLPTRSGEAFDVTIWDVEGRSAVGSIRVDEGGAVGDEIAWSPNGEMLAVLSTWRPTRVSVFDVSSGLETHTTEAGPVTDITFADDSTIVLALPNDERLAIWDLRTSATRHLETPGIGPERIEVVRGTGQVALIGRNPLRLEVWDVERSGREWSTFLPQPVTPRFPGLTVDATAGTVAVSLVDELAMFDVYTGLKLRDFEVAAAGIRSIQYAADRQRLVGMSSDGEMVVWDTRPGGYDSVQAGSGPPCGVAVSPDGRRAIATGADGTVTVVDLDSGATVLSVEDQQVGYDRPATVSRDWRRMAWVDENGETWVRDAQGGERLVELPDCTVPKAFSLDGSMILLQPGCDGDRTPAGGVLMVVDSATGRVRLTLEGSEVYGRSAAFVAVPGLDGREFLVADIDGVLRIHEMPSGEIVASVPAPTGVWGVTAVDAEGRYVAAAGETAVELFDLADLIAGEPADDARVATIDTGKPIAGVSLDPHGHVATSEGGELVVVDSLENRVIAEPAVTIDTPPFAAFSADGRFLVHADGHGLLRRLDVDPDAIVERARERVTRPMTEAECERYLGGSCT